MMIAISTDRLDVAAHEQAVAHPAAGAVVVFKGVVRDHDGGRGVNLLEYEAHPTAEAVLRDIATEIAADPQVYGIAVSHRIGKLEVGEVALVAAVATAHRAEAYEVSRELVERIKAELPVWKRQSQADGRSTWVGI